MHRHLRQSLEEIAGKYRLNPAAVHAAMSYYYDHQAQVDAQIASDDAFVEAFEKKNPSPLGDRLRGLSGA